MHFAEKILKNNQFDLLENLSIEQMDIAVVTDILAHLYKLGRYDIIENYFIPYRKEFLRKIAKEFGLDKSKHCLIEAVKKRSLKYALALLALKKNPKGKDLEGDSLLHLLMPIKGETEEKFKNDLLEMLISRYNLDFECTNKDSLTPLMLAFDNSFMIKEEGVWELGSGKAIIKTMIVYGADPCHSKTFHSIWYINMMMLASSTLFRVLKDIPLLTYVGEGIRKLVDFIERIIICIKIYNDTKLYTYYKLRQYISKEYCKNTMINWIDTCFIGCSHSNFLGLVARGEGLKDLLENCFGYYNLDKAIYKCDDEFLLHLKHSSKAERRQLLKQFVSRYAQVQKQIREAFWPWHQSSLEEVLYEIEEAASKIKLGAKPIGAFFTCMEKICEDLESLSLFLRHNTKASNIFYQLLSLIDNGVLKVDFTLRLKMHDLFNFLNQSYKEEKAFNSSHFNELFEQLNGILMQSNFIHYKEQDYNFTDLLVISQKYQLNLDKKKAKHAGMEDLGQSALSGIAGAVVDSIAKIFSIDKDKVEKELCNGVAATVGFIDAIGQGGYNQFINDTNLGNLNFPDKLKKIWQCVWDMKL